MAPRTSCPTLVTASMMASIRLSGLGAPCAAETTTKKKKTSQMVVLIQAKARRSAGLSRLALYNTASVAQSANVRMQKTSNTVPMALLNSC